MSGLFPRRMSADYRDRVSGDLDRWIQAGLVDEANREPILATLPTRSRVDAVIALIWVAAVLLGLAVIAFIAANWDGIPRVPRFALVLVAFLAAAVAGAETFRRGRQVVADILLTLAALIFAAAIGLTGQIFELTGNPPAAPYGTGVAALGLGLAGRSRGALAIGVGSLMIGDVMIADAAVPVPVSMIVSPLVLLLGLRWRSELLTHVASVAVLGVAVWFAGKYELRDWALIGVAAVLTAAAVAPTVLRQQNRPLIRIPVTWFVIGALLFFIAAGLDSGGLVHRVAWIVVSIGLITFGRFDRQPMLTGVGVLSLIAASCALLSALGLNLIVISLVFLSCSLVALVVGLVLRSRAKGDGPQ